jgi:oligopeptide transport system substrate-binding protein
MAEIKPNTLKSRDFSMNQSRFTIFFLALNVALGGAGCTHRDQAVESAVLRRGLEGEPSTLDPALAADNFSFEVLTDLFEGLTTDGPNGETLPGVAESWVVDQAGIEYTFKLRADARWSNGDPIRAQDFIGAWRRVVDPNQASPVADDLRIIFGAASIIDGKAAPASLGVYAPNESTLVVKLEKPAPYLPQLLAHSAAYPMHFPRTVKVDSRKEWVSNGAYVLSAWSPGTKIELTKNPNYWDSSSVRIQTVEYQIADINSQYARYRAGQLDMTDNVPPSAVATLKQKDPNDLIIAPFLATAYYGLNLSVPPFANNPFLRKALAMAIDRNLLVKSLAFGQVAAYGFVPPGTWNYGAQSWPWRDLGDSARIREARNLYTQAGYSKDEPLHIRLLFNSNPIIKNTAIIISQMWREVLGIETVLTDEEYRVFLQSRHDKTKWDVARLGWTADYNDASNFLDIFRDHSNNNDAGYANPSFDALLDEAAQQSDPAHRRELLETGERTMLADYPVIPLYFFVSKRLVKPYIHGVKINPLNRVPSKPLSIDAGLH